MSLKISHKYSTAAGTPPVSGDIDVGEIAINAADAELYTKDNAGNIRKFQNTTTGTANGVQFTQVGTGAVQRTVQSKLQDVVSVRDFGAIGNSVTDDTAAIQAAATAAQALGTLFFPPGTYLISSPISIVGSNRGIQGAGDSKSLIYTTSNITMFELDNTAEMSSGVIQGIGFQANITGTRTSNIGIRVKSSTTAWFAHWKFIDLRFIGVNTCWSGDGKPTSLIDGYNVANYGYLTFTNWHTQANSLGHYPDYGIRFLGGPGAHNTYSSLHISANTYGISMGDGVVGVGDQLILGCDFSFCDAGIYINGPASLSEYRDRITVTACQFDALSTNACQFIRTRDFRLIGNNLGGIEHILDNCSDYQVDDIETYESRYAVRKFNLAAGSTTDLFEIDLTQSPILNGFSVLTLDIAVHSVNAGAGSAFATYTYAVEFTSGVPVVTEVRKYEKVAGGITTITPSVVSNKARFAATINSTTSGSYLAASVTVNGQFYKLNRL